MGGLKSLTPAQVAAIAGVLPAPATTFNGTVLYADNCASCHGPLASTTKKGRTAAAIQAAIDSNAGGNMGGLSILTPAQVAAIAGVLPAPATTLDGTVLYADNCASCHGPLAWTTKPGRTAIQIQTAIDNNVGNATVGFMGGLKTVLTGEQVTAIAAVLATQAQPTDGPGLYSVNCASCHNPRANSAKAGASAAEVQAAINGNTGGMGTLKPPVLTETR